MNTSTIGVPSEGRSGQRRTRKSFFSEEKQTYLLYTITQILVRLASRAKAGPGNDTIFAANDKQSERVWNSSLIQFTSIIKGSLRDIILLLNHRDIYRDYYDYRKGAFIELACLTLENKANLTT